MSYLLANETANVISESCVPVRTMKTTMTVPIRVVLEAAQRKTLRFT
jgi:hypothetical protein